MHHKGLFGSKCNKENWRDQNPLLLRYFGPSILSITLNEPERYNMCILKLLPAFAPVCTQFVSVTRQTCFHPRAMFPPLGPRPKSTLMKQSRSGAWNTTKHFWDKADRPLFSSHFPFSTTQWHHGNYTAQHTPERVRKNYYNSYYCTHANAERRKRKNVIVTRSTCCVL